MILAEHVVKNYAAVRALDDVSLEFPDGKISVLLGPSGSGKSTLLRMLNRMGVPDSGRILLDGRDVRSMDPVALRRGMGYVVQGVGLFPHLSIAANIGLVPSLLGWPQARISKRVEELLDIVHLPPSFAGRWPRQLSGGEAQRVGVARALAGDPPILLMDEPFGALDIQTRELLQTEFLRIQKTLRKTVVFVTHDVGEAVRLGDRLAILKSGRLVQSGSALDFLSSPADAFVHDFFGPRYRLELLNRQPIMPFIEYGEPPQGMGKLTGTLPGPESTLGDALLAMLAAGAPAIRVQGPQGLGFVRFESLSGASDHA